MRMAFTEPRDAHRRKAERRRNTPKRCVERVGMMTKVRLNRSITYDQSTIVKRNRNDDCCIYEALKITTESSICTKATFLACKCYSSHIETAWRLAAFWFDNRLWARMLSWL
jgi:hypothetical protein